MSATIDFVTCPECDGAAVVRVDEDADSWDDCPRCGGQGGFHDVPLEQARELLAEAGDLSDFERDLVDKAEAELQRAAIFGTEP